MISNPPTLERIYLFVDGAYLRRLHDENLQSLFGEKANLDLALVKGSVGAQRAFYYDCLKDKKADGESEEDFRKRLGQQQANFDAIQSVPGVHLRLGSLTGKPPRLRQKKVDVLLAVEALDHGFRRNMDTACLIAGDLDFAPLVDSLVRLGIVVRVYYEKRSAARELYAAADVGQPITLTTLYSWSEASFRAKHPLPDRQVNAGPPPNLQAGYQLVKQGHLNGESIQLWKEKGSDCHLLFLPSYQGVSLQVSDSDRSRLERFVEIEYGSIDW